MDPRYVNADIRDIFSNANKLRLWQETEIAVIEAGVELGTVPPEAAEEIIRIWRSTPIDEAWWLARDNEIRHDLNAFVDERARRLRPELHRYVHRKITSFDTEEPAFARMLIDACNVVREHAHALLDAVRSLALEHRYTIMEARTHCQGAELQSFGARCLTWHRDLSVANEALEESVERNLGQSKLSGAIGKYGSLDPKLEKLALAKLGFVPHYGATQIMPRVIYAPVAQALGNLTLVVHKAALDIRLNSRSGRPLVREPFGKSQKGSSAMPHKKNNTITEQTEGMARMAQGYVGMITANIPTWEERAIEQSCVERVAWPDLFHAAIRALSAMKSVIAGLVVYPENMLAEVHESCGTYASPDAKEFLKERLPLGHEDVYRLVQLASFNVFEPSEERIKAIGGICRSLDEATVALAAVSTLESDPVVSIRDLIMEGGLRPSRELDIAPEKVDEFNRLLRELFADAQVVTAWQEIFTPKFLLRREDFLYGQILGV